MPSKWFLRKVAAQTYAAAGVSAENWKFMGLRRANLFDSSVEMAAREACASMGPKARNAFASTIPDEDAYHDVAKTLGDNGGFDLAMASLIFFWFRLAERASG